MDQAERERTWALVSARAEGIAIRTLAGTGVGTGLSPRRGSADPYSGRRVAGQGDLVCHHEHAAKFWK
jgi:hypothetical protein